MSNELRIAGMGVSKNVISQIVGTAAEKVEGVAAIYGQDIARGLIAMLTSKPQPTTNAVECSVADDDSVRLVVFFGYPFTKLAAEVRSAVANAVDAQIGVRVSSIDVCIDELIFPKE